MRDWNPATRKRAVHAAACPLIEVSRRSGRAHNCDGKYLLDTAKVVDYGHSPAPLRFSARLTFPRTSTDKLSIKSAWTTRTGLTKQAAAQNVSPATL